MTRDLDALPGIDEQLLAAGEDNALVRLLVDRHGFAPDEAREVVQHELSDDVCEAPDCWDRAAVHAEYLHALTGPSITTIAPRKDLL